MIQATSSAQPLLILDDGNISDVVAKTLALSDSQWDVVAIVTEVFADTVQQGAMEITGGLLSLFNKTIPYGASMVKPTNSFPYAYRTLTYYNANITALKDVPIAKPCADGDVLLKETLEQADESSLTVLCTAPITALTKVLEKVPSLASKIKEVHMMGGAYKAIGNLNAKIISPMLRPICKTIGNTTYTSEWNIFWDPAGFQGFLKKTTMPFHLYPLDITNQAPLGENFQKQLKAQGEAGFTMSKVASQSYDVYKQVLGLKPSNYSWTPFAWDELAAAGAANPPGVFAPPIQASVTVPPEGHQQGCLMTTQREENSLFTQSSKTRQGYTSTF